MPNRRKPTNVLEFAGAFRKDPKRARARAKEPRDLGPLTKPADLSAEESLAWDAIVSIAPAGVLKDRDGEIVRYAAKLRVLIDRNPKAAYLSLYRLTLADLGMTPSAASKVAAESAEEPEGGLHAI